MACQCFLVGIGLAALVYFIYRILLSIYSIIYPFFIATPINLLQVSGGNWAVVTGSTDGIGKAYAFELARKGFKMLLISRTQSKLDDVKADIERETKTEVKTLAFDFTSGDLKEYEQKIFPTLDGLDIGILVNNVGLSYEYPDVLHKVEGGLKRLADIDIVNTLPPTLLSVKLLPIMVERNSGIIVNISSSAAYHQMQMWGVYSATKKFVNWLGGIMRREYARTNIIIQTVCPMLVATKMSKVSRTSLFTPSAEQFAKSAVRTIGIVDETTGYFSHQLQMEGISFAPSFLANLIIESQTKTIHKKAIAKKLREAKKTVKCF